MRFLAALLFWLVTTVAARGGGPRDRGPSRTWSARTDTPRWLPTAAKDPQLQEAMASELTTQITRAGRRQRLRRSTTPSWCAGWPPPTPPTPGFPGQFAQANRIAHRWMFTDSVQHDQADGDRWLVDIAPMLSDDSLRQTLGNLNLDVPETLTVPITVPESSSLRPGQLKMLSTWGPWASIGVAVLTGRVRAADAGGCPLAGQSACRAGCFGTSRRRGGLGRARGRQALRRRRAEPHDRRHPHGGRRHGQHGRSQPAPVAEPDAGRGRRAGGVRRRWSRCSAVCAASE